SGPNVGAANPRPSVSPSGPSRSRRYILPTTSGVPGGTSKPGRAGASHPPSRSLPGAAAEADRRATGSAGAHADHAGRLQPVRLSDPVAQVLEEALGVEHAADLPTLLQGLDPRAAVLADLGAGLPAEAGGLDGLGDFPAGVPVELDPDLVVAVRA